MLCPAELQWRAIFTPFGTGTLIEVIGVSMQAMNKPLDLQLKRKFVMSERSAEQRSSPRASAANGERAIWSASAGDRLTLACVVHLARLLNPKLSIDLPTTVMTTILPLLQSTAFSES
jgi:hypothetical protein